MSYSQAAMAAAAVKCHWQQQCMDDPIDGPESDTARKRMH
jgi:hypothetical protein